MHLFGISDHSIWALLYCHTLVALQAPEHGFPEICIHGVFGFYGSRDYLQIKHGNVDLKLCCARDEKILYRQKSFSSRHLLAEFCPSLIRHKELVDLPANSMLQLLLTIVLGPFAEFVQTADCTNKKLDFRRHLRDPNFMVSKQVSSSSALSPLTWVCNSSRLKE